MKLLPTFWQRSFYATTAVWMRLFLGTFWRLSCHGKEYIPRQGKLLLASNHASNADPPIVGTCMPRPIFYFAKEELFRVPVLGWVIRQLNAFAVRRFDHDIGAFKTAQLLLEKEQAVLIFPEGRRSKTGALGPAKAGIAMLAFKTGAPVLPLRVFNSREFGKFKKITVVFGPVLRPSAEQLHNKNYQSFADQIMHAIAQLRPKNV